MAQSQIHSPPPIVRSFSCQSIPSRQPAESRHHSPAMANQQGFTYLMAMLFVVLIGISLMMIGQQWSVIVKRDKEAELLFRGNRIKEAIERFVADYEVQKATRPNRYPLTLKELVKKPKRYLQVVYKDPITGEDFALIKDASGIRGVQSTSEDVPYDQVNFKGAQTYKAVRFEAAGPSSNCAPNPQNPLLPANCQQNPGSPQGSPSPATSPPTSNQPSPEPNEP